MNYHNILETKIHIMITNDLTIGRVDNDLIPFNCDQINQFILNNKNNIELAITKIINDYTNDNDIELLQDPLFDWIGEYLYDFVNTQID